MILISMEKLRRDFAESLNEVRYHGEAFVLTKHGRPIAKLLPLEKSDLQKIEATKKQNRKSA